MGRMRHQFGKQLVTVTSLTLRILTSKVPINFNALVLTASIKGHQLECKHLQNVEKKLRAKIFAIEKSGKDPYILNNDIVKVQREIQQLKEYIHGLENISDVQGKELLVQNDVK